MRSSKTLCEEAILVQRVTQSADKPATTVVIHIIIIINIIVNNSFKSSSMNKELKHPLLFSSHDQCDDYHYLRFNNLLQLCNCNTSGIKCYVVQYLSVPPDI